MAHWKECFLPSKRRRKINLAMCRKIPNPFKTGRNPAMKKKPGKKGGKK
jgi:hypothetical protein